MASGRMVLHSAVTEMWLSLQQQVWGSCSPARRRKDPGGEPSTPAVERIVEEVAPAADKPQVAADDTVITMTQLVLPSDASQEGSLLAGPLLKWIDICACMSAERFSGVNCVTAMMEDIHFLNKVQVGQVIVLTARVHQAWNTSMEVGVIVTIDRLRGKRTAKPVLCCRARSTFVSKDKAELPQLTMISEEQKTCGEEATARKAMRMKVPRKKDAQDERPAIAEGTTVSTELVMPHHCQHMGTTFGGWVMQWMESAASIAAARYTRLQMACVSTDTVHFLAPSHTGEAIEFRAVVTGVWNTSLEVGCWATAEDLRSGTSKAVCQMYATYVVSEKSPDRRRTLPQLPSGTMSAQQVTNAYQRRIARMQRRALESVGELSVDAASFGDKAARSAVRDLEALAQSDGPTSSMGPPTNSEASTNSAALLGASSSSHQISLSWEVLFNGPEHDLPVVVDALEGSTTCIRFSFALGAPPDRVHELVNDFESRKKWDEVIVKAEPLRAVTSDGSQLDSSYKPGVPVTIDALRLTLASSHELTIARARMVDPAAGTFTSVSRSVKHPDAPPTEVSKRVEVLPSGWVLKSDGQGGCRTIYLLQLGSRALGALLSSMKDGSMMSNADLTTALLKGKENKLDITGGMLPAAVKSVITLMGTLPPKKP